MADCKDIAGGVLGAKGAFLLGLDCFLSGSLFGFALLFGVFSSSLRSGGSGFRVFLLNLSHNINLILKK